MPAFNFRFDKRGCRPAHWLSDEGDDAHRKQDLRARMGARGCRHDHFARRHSPPL